MHVSAWHCLVAHDASAVEAGIGGAEGGGAQGPHATLKAKRKKYSRSHRILPERMEAFAYMRESAKSAKRENN